MQQENKSRGARKTLTGTVIANQMDKTVVVEVQRVIRHPRYEKVVYRRKKFYAHDEGNQCQVGDKVTIVETRPMSKLKRWRVTAA